MTAPLVDALTPGKPDRSFRLVDLGSGCCAWCGGRFPLPKLTRITAVRTQGRVEWYLLRCETCGAKGG